MRCLTWLSTMLSDQSGLSETEARDALRDGPDSEAQAAKPQQGVRQVCHVG